MALALVTGCSLMVSIVIVSAGLDVQSRNSTEANTTLEDNRQEAAPPAHSMHRLNPSVLDNSVPSGNSSSFSPGNITDTAPFLPSVVVPPYSSPHQLVEHSNLSKTHRHHDFTPSYFIGEVIPEPYVPERLQNSRTYQVNRNSSNTSRSYQSIEPSQTIMAAKKVLPFIEKMKLAAALHSSMQNFANGHGYFPEYVPPVHEPSVEDEDCTTPKYETQFRDDDQHSDRPNHLPYQYYRGQQNVLSTKPITFDDNTDEHDPHSHTQDYNHHHQLGSSVGGYYDQSGSYGGLRNPYDDQPTPYKGYHHHGGLPDNSESNAHQNYNSHLSPHHETDLVLPSPFYPPEPEHPVSHHKGVLYKVYQHKPKSPLKGLLHLAATLIPLGLFVAALQPSIIHVNSTQSMPGKQRSLEGNSPALPGLAALERLGLERLDRTDCEKRAFCELAVLGSQPQASGAQQGLWKMANSIPEQYAATLGLTEMLKAVKSSSCSSLKCESSIRTEEAISSKV